MIILVNTNLYLGTNLKIFYHIHYDVVPAYAYIHALIRYCYCRTYCIINKE